MRTSINIHAAYIGDMCIDLNGQVRPSLGHIVDPNVYWSVCPTALEMYDQYLICWVSQELMARIDETEIVFDTVRK